MSKKKALLSTDNPKWWNEKPMMAHMRDLEDAFGDYLAVNHVDLTSFHKDDMAFEELLYYLGCVHERWVTIKANDFAPSKHLCFRGLSQAVSNWRKSPKKMAELK